MSIQKPSQVEGNERQDYAVVNYFSSSEAADFLRVYPPTMSEILSLFSLLCNFLNSTQKYIFNYPYYNCERIINPSS